MIYTNVCKHCHKVFKSKIRTMSCKDCRKEDEETLDEIREETEKAVSDTVRLDTAEILKGVAHNAQQITDEEEAALDGDTVRLDAEALEEAAKEVEKAMLELE